MTFSATWRLFAASLSAVSLLAAASLLSAQEEAKSSDTDESAKADSATSIPLGLPEIDYPDGDPPEPAKVALGKQLFFDTRLSGDGKISCASCHSPKSGWGGSNPVATGIGGQKGTRNAPTLINVAYNDFFFWDGRAASLQEQALGPMTNPIEMGMTVEEIENTVNSIEGYRKQFQEVFGAKANIDLITKAIAAYERTILAGNAPYDQYKAGDKDALSAAAKRGMELFFGKANCSACHPPPTFTDNAFHNIGVGWHDSKRDIGRYKISDLGGDKGSFKTPTLRDIARTAPYMHDGSMKTLEEVVRHYNKGGTPNPYQDEEIFKLNLTEQEIDDLVTFMKEGLTSEDYPMHKPPELPE